MQLKEFTFNNQVYDYLYDGERRQLQNERVVEVPIVWREVQKYNADSVLEVGCVLPVHYKTEHDIVDKYEKCPTNPRLLNVDIVGFKPDKKYKLVVCVSTLEHIGAGWKDEGIQPDKPRQALESMHECLANNGIILVTVPVGPNRMIEERWGDLGLTKTLCMKRVSEDNEWIETSWDEAIKCIYAKPYPGGNGLLVGYYENSIIHR